MPRIAYILNNSFVNGPDCRTVFFFAGCKHSCKGCHNQHLWPMNSGIKMHIHELYKAVDDNIDMIGGITVSGGEPFLQPRTLFRLVHYAKTVKNLNVWVYTGYTVQELLAIDNKYIKYALKYIDTLVDGKYIEELKNDNLEWRGSSNQNIIHLSEVVSVTSYP